MTNLMNFFFFFFSASKMPQVNVERDAGFCSGSSENGDEFQRDEPHSPTDASEDSIEVKLTPIVIPKNKRKSLEPSKVIMENEYPLKKRIKYEDQSIMTQIKTECSTDINPFRPWASVTEPQEKQILNPAEIHLRHPAVTTLHRVIDSTQHQHQQQQDQPLALLKKRTTSDSSSSTHSSSSSSDSSRNILKNATNTETTYPSKNLLDPNTFMDIINISSAEEESSQTMLNTNSSDSFGSGNKLTPTSANQHRNYKNMTRERRIEANARERTRVHTISAAFDTLRKSIPSYSQSQKLSKLSVLRVACSYILTLSRIAGDDYSPDQSEPSVNECTDEVSRTIQTEGKIRKKKDE